LSPGALAKAGKRHPAARLESDWKQVINDPTVDAVMVATPVESHFRIAMAALQAGKHVLVEKPITPTSREASMLVAEAKTRGLILMVDHTYVYTGAVRKIRDLVTKGDVGDIYYYDSTRVNLGLFQHDVNVIWDLAVHDLAILDFLLDASPTAVSANGANHVTGGPDNMAYITLYFESGAIAHVNVNWLAPVKIRQTLIGGSRRMIVYDDLQPSEKVKVYDRGVNLTTNENERHKMLVSYRMGDMWAPELSVKEALLTEIEHFGACVRKEATPMTSGESGLRVVKALEAATISLHKHGHPVELFQLKEAS
ncbi:MAG: Gfo/Idh/MocA family protein, partial [Steroidobacterales bacterium]